MNKKKIVIIGAGIGGLGAAALLAQKGHSVTVLEKNKQLGGRAMVYEEKGFRFDMGPSWYLMPDVFERFYAEFGKKPSDFFKLQRLDPQYRIFFSEKEQLDIHSSLEKNLELFESIEKGSSKKISQYLEQSKYQYEVAMEHFVYKNYNSITDFFNKQLLKEGPKLHVFESLDRYISRFTKNPKLKKILEYTMVFLGGSPQNTPALYSIMSHIDFHMGVFYPMKGVHTIIESLELLCKTYKTQIKTNQDVTKIMVKNGKVTGVKTKTKTYPADLVISNADYPFTETQLLEKKWQSFNSSYWKKKTIAPSAFIMYLGVKGKVKKLQHHNLFLANDWEKHFNEIFKNPGWPEQPSYYVCCPSKTDSSVAPKDDENIFILVPIAAGIKDSESQRVKYSQFIIEEIEKTIGEKFSDRIMVKKTHSLRDYSTLYHAYKGTALGLAHTLFQTAVFRPGNKSKKVQNLYYTGQYTLPGVGMPMCLISAQLTANRIEKDLLNS